MEYDTLEEVAAFRIVGVLVKGDDVAPVAGDQAAHCCDDPRLVRTVNDQARLIPSSTPW